LLKVNKKLVDFAYFGAEFFGGRGTCFLFSVLL